MRAVLVTLPLHTAAAGCADPYTEPRPATPPSVAGELPAERVPPEPVPTTKLAPGAEAAVRKAVELTGTWTADTIARQHERFAAASTGAARRDAQRTAAQATTDPHLSAPGARSSAVLQAAIPRAGGRFLVVTHETLVADGLREARYRVTLAEAQKVRDGWVLRRWERQP